MKELFRLTFILGISIQNINITSLKKHKRHLSPK